jgi:hypothetical protein
MNKPTIFISHIAEEKEIAKALKEFLDQKFLKTVDVFVSSHQESVQLGDDWLTTIKKSMIDCQLVIILCSPISISRPWVNFEAGAGWVKNIPVIPLCHSGLTPGTLPVPVNSFQGGLLNSEDDIAKVFSRIADLLNISKPDTDSKEFFEAVSSFEAEIQSGLLVKDTTFLFNLVYRQVELLKYSIYASTLSYEALSKIDIQNESIQNHNFSFNDTHNLFNVSLLTIHTQKKVFQAYHTTAHELADNIKFLLSYDGIQIAPQVRELLHEMLFSVVKVDDWYHAITLLERQTENTLKDMCVEMIKKEPSPPTRRFSNIINNFIDYFESLIFYSSWISRFEMEVSNILKK